MSKILVTGGFGYIGSHTVVELIKNNHEVIIVDNLSNSSINVLEGIEKISGKKPTFHKLELTDQLEVMKFFKNQEDITGIIHFAAYKAVGESVDDPIKYYENNLYSLINLLKAVSEYNINFIFSSSCTVYGQADILPVTENTPSKPAESPYGNTKQICEEILIDYTNIKTNLKVISLRYFNPIGAHLSLHIGELSNGKPQNLIPFITQTAAGIHESLTVFGNDYNTHDGTCLRDYIDVVDLAEAHVAALNKLENKTENSRYEVLNLGTGNPSSVLDVIKSFEKVSGEKLNYTFGPRRRGDVEAAYADTSKANDYLSWCAKTSLDSSVLNAWLWEKKIRKIK